MRVATLMVMALLLMVAISVPYSWDSKIQACNEVQRRARAEVQKQLCTVPLYAFTVNECLGGVIM
jgi:hypothetical protein